MTPEEAQAAYNAMTPDTRAAFHTYLQNLAHNIAAIDHATTTNGQQLAHQTEEWLKGERE